MTVYEATNKLFVWFQDNDSFEMSEDFNSVILISETEDRDKATLELSLESLQKAELIKQKTVGDKTYWILSKPWSQFESTVTVNSRLASGIAESINEFCDLINDDTDLCDATDLKEKDIGNLLFMYRQAKEMLGKSKDPEEGV